MAPSPANHAGTDGTGAEVMSETTLRLRPGRTKRSVAIDLRVALLFSQDSQENVRGQALQVLEEYT